MVTVKQLRAVLDQLPDHAAVLVDVDERGTKFASDVAVGQTWSPTLEELTTNVHIQVFTPEYVPGAPRWED